MDESILSMGQNNHNEYLSSDSSSQNPNSSSGLLPYGGMAPIPYDLPQGASPSGASTYNMTTSSDYWANSADVEDIVKSLVPIEAFSDESIVVVGNSPPPASGNPPIGIGGNTGGGGGGGGGGSSIVVVGHKSGFDHVVTINGTDFIQASDGGLVSSNRFDGNNVTVTPLPLTQIIQKTDDLYQKMYERNANDQDRLWISQELYNPSTVWKSIVSIEAHNSESTAALRQAILDIQGRTAETSDDAWIQAMQNSEQNGTDSLSSIYMNTAVFTGEHAGYDSIIHDVQDRNRSDEDTNWIRAQEQSIGNRQQTYASVRASLIDVAGEGSVINQFIYQNVHDRAAQQIDLDYARSQMHSGASIQQIIWNEAHNQESTTTINDVYKIVFGREADSGGMQTWQNYIGNGATLNDAISNISHSNEAKTQVSGFLVSNIGYSNDLLIGSGQKILTNITQAYEDIRNYYQENIIKLANGYQSVFSSAGNIIDSLMPQTWGQWLGLAANLAIVVTPPGEAVAAIELTVIGGDELLAAALDTEANIAIKPLATTGANDLITTVSQSEIDMLTQFTPRQAGATLDIGDGIVVTQTEGDLSKAGALIFKGGNFDAVSTYFKQLTGYSGDLEAIRVNSSGIRAGVTVYKIKTNLGEVTLRNITSSTGDWTIDLGERLNNGIKEIKFNF